MIKAPICYFGGKYNMLKKLETFYPKDYQVFIDVFGGSGVVALNNSATIKIYNDVNKNCYALYRVLQDKELFEQFKYKAELSHWSEDLAHEFRNVLKSNEESMVDRAYHFWYTQRLFRGGMGGLKINLIKRRNSSKSVSDLLSSIEGLQELHEHVQNMIVLNRDGLELIEKYGNNFNTFMYLDPPYLHSTRKSKTRYEDDQPEEFHIKLIELLKNVKAKFLLSGYDNELYDSVGWNKSYINVATVDGNNKPKTSQEVVWYNYENL